jgi:hypothetical protein
MLETAFILALIVLVMAVHTLFTLENKNFSNVLLLSTTIAVMIYALIHLFLSMVLKALITVNS